MAGTPLGRGSEGETLVAEETTGALPPEVAASAEILARSSGFSDEDCRIMRIAGHLHDLGKLGVPDSVLCKPGPVLPGFGAQDDPDGLCSPGFFHDGKAPAQDRFGVYVLHPAGERVECQDPRFCGECDTNRVKEAGTDEEDAVCPGIPCRSETAAEYLPPVGCPAASVRNADRNSMLF